jgi:hypothetical protein
MRYRIIETNATGCVVTELPSEIELLAWLAENDHEMIGRNANPRQRAELQGHPKLRNFCGPMWGGDHVRYECVETYRQMSI